MSAATAGIADSVTMLRRNLVHMRRYPALTVFLIGIPVLLLALFVYAFGGTLGAGLPTAGTGDAQQDYLAYVVPGILLIGVAGLANNASIGIAQDLTEGIVARFRTMAISRAAVLNGHVLGNTLQGLVCLAAVVGVALLMGYRPAAGPVAWIVLVAFLALVCFAVSWVAVAIGMSADSVESASNWPMVFTLLPFLGSGFVPTDSMPGWLGAFARWQPFTPFIETTRDLLAGRAPDALDGGLALAWCAVFVVAGALWARRRYERASLRS